MIKYKSIFRLVCAMYFLIIFLKPNYFRSNIHHHFYLLEVIEVNIQIQIGHGVLGRLVQISMHKALLLESIWL